MIEGTENHMLSELHFEIGTMTSYAYANRQDLNKISDCHPEGTARTPEAPPGTEIDHRRD